MTETRSLMFVGAHPDDETFGLGGTLAKYAAAGVHVVYACATRGELGEADPEHLSGHASRGDMRWAELTCAARELGLAEVVHLGYRDSGMAGSPDNQHPESLAAAPLEDVTARVVKVLREHRPQVVITFDPIGGYRHPDHIAIHQATVAAFQAAGDPAQYPDLGPAYQPAKLYYLVFPRAFLRLAVRLMRLLGRDPRRFGRNGDIDLVDLTRDDFPVHAVINIRGAPARRRAAASECHRSQLEGGPTGRSLMGFVTGLLQLREVYMRVQPPAPNGQKKENDLFEGIA